MLLGDVGGMVDLKPQCLILFTAHILFLQHMALGRSLHPTATKRIKEQNWKQIHTPPAINTPLPIMHAHLGHHHTLCGTRTHHTQLHASASRLCAR